MDKEHVVYNGVLLSHKKNEMMSCAATGMDLEIVILSEVSQTEKDNIPYIWNLKKGTNELVYKTESYRCRKQTYSYQADKGSRDKLGDWN